MRPLTGRTRALSRQGFTITELLIAATISLILTYAVVQMFDYVASEARYGRASIELASQLRNASRRISTDLACATAPARPFADRHGQGYFEYLEGPGSDSVAMIYNAGGAYPTTTTGTYTPVIRTSNIDASLPTVAVETSLGGDIDDVLMFTAYNPDEPFRGRYTPYVFDSSTSTWTRGQTRIEESKYAEIAIWTVRLPNNRVQLYRRALLIRPDLQAAAFGYYAAPSPQFPLPPTTPAYDEMKYRMQTLYQENDISVRIDSGFNGFVGNSLGDLSRRENRFAHLRSATSYQYPIDAQELQLHDPAFDRTVMPFLPGWLLTNDTTRGLYYEGNDVLLAEVLAFDVKAFDPTASVRLDKNHFHMTPSDPGYETNQGHSGAGGRLTVQTGAFVDLGYNVTHNTTGAGTWFTGNGTAKSRLVDPNYFMDTQLTPRAGEPTAANVAFRTYCTWTNFYETNGIDENGDGIVDGGMNQIDDDLDGPSNSAHPNGLVDELAEWDTLPPYLNPLRGVQVTLRVMEPNSRQVRQMSVVQNFTGE